MLTLNKPIPEKAMALPFSIDFYGNVSTSTVQEKIWADKVRSVIGTMHQERVMRPNFGSGIPGLIWDTEEITMNHLEDEIRSAFTSQLSGLTLEDVDVTFDARENIITANIVYLLPNDKESTQIIGIASVPTNTTPMSEELL